MIRVQVVTIMVFPDVETMDAYLKEKVSPGLAEKIWSALCKKKSATYHEPTPGYESGVKIRSEILTETSNEKTENNPSTDELCSAKKSE